MSAFQDQLSAAFLLLSLDPNPEAMQGTMDHLELLAAATFGHEACVSCNARVEIAERQWRRWALEKQLDAYKSVRGWTVTAFFSKEEVLQASEGRIAEIETKLK